MSQKPDQKGNTRAQAAGILVNWFQTGQFPDRQIEKTAPAHRAMTMELVYGSVRHLRPLDFFISRLTNRQPDPTTRAVLHVGLYQLFHMDRTEAFAAVHETVEAARILGRPQAAPMVNAVLRRAQREQADLLAALSKQSLAVRTSHPDELVARWLRHLGKARTEALCAWNSERSHICLRPMAGTLADFLSRLHAAGIAAEPHPFDPHRFLMLPHGVRVPSLPGYAEGAFVVQDPATAVAVDLLDLRPGQRVLDACAAPGGKTLLIAERLWPEPTAQNGLLVAADLYEDRLRTLRENLRRMHAAKVTVTRLDLTNRNALAHFRREFSAQGFDRILLDVPCSNTGVIQRRPDARYRMQPDRLASLVQTQHDLLTSSLTLLARGGRIVYSTCSLEPEENGEGLRRWLARQPKLEIAEEKTHFPPDTQTDGAYAAAIVSAAG